MIKKNNKSQPDDFILETSVQIDKLTNAHVRQQIDEIKLQGDLRSSYFIIYEFKTSIIKSLIDFYFLVDIEGISTAFGLWKDVFSAREPKHVLTVLSVILTTHSLDKDDALHQLEAAIIFILNNFYSDIQPMLIGDFAGDQIAEYKISHRGDFQDFLDAYNERKIIPLDEFFQNKISDLDKIIEANNLKGSKGDQLINKLKNIKEDPVKANKFRINKAVGDVVISLDTPRHHTIVTLDKDYNSLCNSLDKKVILLEKKPKQ